MSGFGPATATILDTSNDNSPRRLPGGAAGKSAALPPDAGRLTGGAAFHHRTPGRCRDVKLFNRFPPVLKMPSCRHRDGVAEKGVIAVLRAAAAADRACGAVAKLIGNIEIEMTTISSHPHAEEMPIQVRYE